MIPFALFDIAEAVGRWVMWAFVSVLNLLVVALGGILSGIASLFPELPAVVGPPAGNSDALAAIAWLFPFGALVVVLTALIVGYVSILGFRVIARWVKVL